MLGEALRGAGERHVIVTAHHPLATGGPHGGYFTLGQHVFPLRDWRDWMWIPLPIIGSVYPLARMIGFSDQDTSGRRNRAMRAALDSTLATAPPLVYASGHSHGLEVLDGGPRAGTLVVSGTGVFGHVTNIAELNETRFRAPGHSGWVRLDFERGGRVRLAVVTVDEAGTGMEAYAAYLEPPP